MKKRVILLGDSIRRIGYGTKVPELLGEEYTVWQPEDNCRFAKYTLRMLWEQQNALKGADVIHWNNGLWDVNDLFGDGNFTSIEEYTDTILRILKILKTYTDKIIFATTTPVNPKEPYNDNETIQRYNNHITKVLREHGVVINDLYTTVAQDIEKYICDDNIHLSEAGIEICSKQVTDAIKALV
ncbi:MAG: SGNH/GDSL hydrolase family protein [Clostridia bacterium]|nr:SGNH/GDSL hydrolase family protein [Clostridia bacterium]